MFLVRRADTAPDPDTPTILTGYGGFAITDEPGVQRRSRSPLRRRRRCTRWPASGAAPRRARPGTGPACGEHKQQVFDDFAAAADWLVDRRAAPRRDRLAIRGGSNGGLLVGAALTQRPDLCRAVHCAVPLLDMVRFPLFLIARLWIPEYGDPDVAEDFAWLHAYSPYHRVVDGTCYPALLVTTGEEDTRVDPATPASSRPRSRRRRPAATSTRPRAGRVPGRPRPGQAGRPAGRRGGRRARLPALAARCELRLSGSGAERGDLGRGEHARSPPARGTPATG